MRAPTDMPRRRTRPPGRGRVLLIVTAVILFILFTSLRQIADIWTDYLWFDSVKLSSVWQRSLTIKLQLGALFTALFFLALWLNLLVADRISPKFRPLGPDEELLNRYHQIIDRRAGLLRVVVSVIFAFITGAGMSSQWNEWILFREGGDFGTIDPQFGLDVGFYIFRLPFLVNLVDWLFAAQVIILLITAVAHYLNGGIRMQAPFERVTPQVKAHLSVLLALLALTKATDYWLQRYQVLFSDRSSIVNGATYTETNAQLPALYLMLFIALASFVLFILNIRRRGWVLPIVAVGLWAFVALVVGEIYPAVYERVIVNPEQSTKEAPAIRYNIDATRKAYGLDTVQVKNFQYSANPDDASRAIDANPQITRNIQLLDPGQIIDNFQALQSLISPSAFSNVDTDRYPMRIPGGGTEMTQVVIANREVNAETIPQKSWEGRILTYTHGYGLALSAGNGVTQGGNPDFAVKNIPTEVAPSIDLTIDQPNNYYFGPDVVSGQTTLNYSIIGTTAPEFNYEKRSSDATKQYTGEGGVPLDSFARRMAFSLKFSDPNLVISQYISDQSRILYMRQISDRVEAVAPFLTYDSDPYPVVDRGRTKYVLDAYTTSEFYPNSQRYPGGLIGSDGRSRSFNYIRNSVKAVVDTYDGTVTLYVVDKSDPVIAAYQAAFPELFKERLDMSQELRDHLRYPQDIFRVQTDMWGRYHITDANAFYSKDNAWEPPPAPPEIPDPAQVAAPPTPVGQNVAASSSPVRAPRMAPYYVLNKLQGDAEANFMLMRAFQPFSDNDSKKQLTAVMVARSDGNDLGQLQVYQMDEKDQIDGPGIVSPRMQSDNAVSTRITQLNQQGSKVRFGDLTIVPVENSLLYVRALYVVASGQPVPVVRNVIVSYGQRVVIRDTLRDALKEMFPNSNPQTREGAVDAPGTPVPVIPPSNTGTSSPGTSTTEPPTTAPGTTTPPSTEVPGGDATALVNSAAQDLQDAQVAFDNKDLGSYQKKVDEATKKIQEAQRLLAAAATPAPTTTTAPST